MMIIIYRINVLTYLYYSAKFLFSNLIKIKWIKNWFIFYESWNICLIYFKNYKLII